MDLKTGDIDGIPTVFMEAMATGRPVISCPISGIPELVRHGETGLLVHPDDPAALAGAITSLAFNDSLRIHLGRQARTLAEQQHDHRMNTRQLLDLMTSVGSVPVYRPNEDRWNICYVSLETVVLTGSGPQLWNTRGALLRCCFLIVHLPGWIMPGRCPQNQGKTSP